MAIYVVDGKTEDAALFECGLSTVVRRDPIASKTVVSSSRDLSIREVDHRDTQPPNATIFGSNSRERVDRLQTLLTQTPMTDLPADLISILGDEIVEDPEGTVYSNVACPGRGEIFFSGGNLPAASSGPWRRIDWPWD